MRVDPIFVRSALAGGPSGGPSSKPMPAKRRAAVAMIVYPAGEGSQLLLIRRADRPGDPWSGQMAFPGGHTEPYDVDSRATAMRETMEEVGLNLSASEHLGALPAVAATARGVPTGTVITPHVFAVHEPAPLSPNRQEVAATYWAPMGPMASGEWDTVKLLEHQGQRLSLPAISVEGNLVWGLTHRMLRDFFTLLSGTAVNA